VAVDGLDLEACAGECFGLRERLGIQLQDTHLSDKQIVVAPS
jgi:hypothetical protein